MDIYYSNRKKTFNAIGIVEDGSDWVVCKGSRINPITSDNIGDEVKLLREKKGTIIDGILQEDMHFKSATKAAQFVSGYSQNGMKAWKTNEGDFISKYINGNRRRPFKKS